MPVYIHLSLHCNLSFTPAASIFALWSVGLLTWLLSTGEASGSKCGQTPVPRDPSLLPVNRAAGVGKIQWIPPPVQIFHRLHLQMSQLWSNTCVLFSAMCCWLPVWISSLYSVRLRQRPRVPCGLKKAVDVRSIFGGCVERKCLAFLAPFQRVWHHKPQPRSIIIIELVCSQDSHGIKKKKKDVKMVFVWRCAVWRCFSSVCCSLQPFSPLLMWIFKMPLCAVFIVHVCRADHVRAEIHPWGRHCLQSSETGFVEAQTWNRWLPTLWSGRTPRTLSQSWGTDVGKASCWDMTQGSLAALH